MVENHVLSVGNASRILILCSYGAHAETHIAYDDIVGTRKGYSVAIDGDALARGGLTCHVEVVLEDDA